MLIFFYHPQEDALSIDRKTSLDYWLSYLRIKKLLVGNGDCNSHQLLTKKKLLNLPTIPVISTTLINNYFVLLAEKKNQQDRHINSASHFTVAVWNHATVKWRYKNTTPRMYANIPLEWYIPVLLTRPVADTINVFLNVYI